MVVFVGMSPWCLFVVPVSIGSCEKIKLGVSLVDGDNQIVDCNHVRFGSTIVTITGGDDLELDCLYNCNDVIVTISLGRIQTETPRVDGSKMVRKQAFK